MLVKLFLSRVAAGSPSWNINVEMLERERRESLCNGLGLIHGGLNADAAKQGWLITCMHVDHRPAKLDRLALFPQ
jgi:hypothetical protein